MVYNHSLIQKVCFFKVDEGIEDPNVTLNWPFKWRFAGGPMMTQH